MTRTATRTTTRILFSGALVALTMGTMGAAHGQADILRPPGVAYAVSQGITAGGHGEVKVKPDIALITIVVTTQSKDQAEAVSQNAARTTTTLAALRAARVADKDIQTQSYTVQPQYDYGNNNGGFGGGSPKPPTLVGYQVTNSVQATVRDLTKVGLVIDKTTSAGASQISGVSFDLSDRSLAESQALALAVSSARRKASIMASAAGVDIGRLLTLTEGASAPSAQPVFAMRAMAKGATETPIADQQITVTADATLVYAMGAAK